MKPRPFKAILLVAVVVPLLASLAGYLLNAPGSDDSTQAVSSIPGDTGEPVLINRVPEAEPMGKASDFDVRGLILYIALLAGTVALLWHYLGSSLAWIAVVILPLAFTFLYKEQAGMGLTLFDLVNLLFAALLALLVKHVFFQRSIIRFRMIATSIAGAVLLTLYLRALYLLTGTAFPSAQYTPYLFSGLVQFIFVTFGMSMADMIIQRSTPRQQRDKDIDDGDGDPDA